MLDDVEDAVQRCRTDPHPSRNLAKSCGTLVSGYLALRARLAVLPPSEQTHRVDQLLTYAMELTRQASLLAFRPHDSNWDALAAAFCGADSERQQTNSVGSPQRRPKGSPAVTSMSRPGASDRSDPAG